MSATAEHQVVLSDYEDVRVRRGRRSGLTMAIAVHRTVDGRALGGCRMRAYATADEAVRDAERLARAMTLKAAVAGLPLGGAKGGIRLDYENRDRPFTFYHEESPWQWMSTTSDWRDNQNANDHVYADLQRAIRGEEVAVGTTPEQAIHITRFTQMALRSAELGREITATEVPIPRHAQGKA